MENNRIRPLSELFQLVYDSYHNDLLCNHISYLMLTKKLTEEEADVLETYINKSMRNRGKYFYLFSQDDWDSRKEWLKEQVEINKELEKQ